jgi:DNA polymerase-4
MTRDAHDDDFPKAILHVDGDSFFVSCELTRRPDLRGRPVVTGEERGIATAVNPAAKKLGVVRGMRTREIRRSFPSVVILPSDYVMYAQYARRMYDIVGRYTDKVEEYSIDECFADLTGLKCGSL